MAVYQESVTVMAMVEFDREEPGAVRGAFHRMRSRVPLIEVADQADRSSVRRLANEIHRAQRLLGNKTIHSNNS